MKKLVSALAILACLVGGMWLVYGSVSSEPETSQATSKAPSSSDLEPFESDQALEQMAQQKSSDDETDDSSNTKTAESTQAQPESGSSDETSDDEQEPVDTEAVVLNVERDEPSESQSTSEPSTPETSKHQPSESSNGPDLPPPEVREKLTELASEANDEEANNLGQGNGSNVPRLSDEVRQQIIKGGDLQQPNTNPLPNGVEQLSEDQLPSNLPSRSR